MACGARQLSKKFTLSDTDWKINLASITPSCNEKLFGDDEFISIPPGIDTNFPSITGVIVTSINLEDTTSSGFRNTMRLRPHSFNRSDVLGEEAFGGHTLFFANSNGYLNGSATGVIDPELPGYSAEIRASVSFAAGWAAVQAEIKADTTQNIVVTTRTIRPENVKWDEPQLLSVY